MGRDMEYTCATHTAQRQACACFTMPWQEPITPLLGNAGWAQPGATRAGREARVKGPPLSLGASRQRDNIRVARPRQRSRIDTTKRERGGGKGKTDPGNLRTTKKRGGGRCGSIRVTPTRATKKSKEQKGRRKPTPPFAGHAVPHHTQLTNTRYRPAHLLTQLVSKFAGHGVGETVDTRCNGAFVGQIPGKNTGGPRIRPGAKSRTHEVQHTGISCPCSWLQHAR